VIGRVVHIDEFDEAVTFEEPLIEQAVRAVLGKNDGELAPEDLAKVTTLYIYGDRVFDKPEEYYACTIGNSEQGSIRNLNDIKKLTELKELHVTNQGYVDATGLAGHGMLECIELKHMVVSNLSALASVANLRSGELFDSGITDATVFQRCAWLDSLDIGNNDIFSLEEVGRSTSLKTLWLSWAKMDNLDEIAERFPNLEKVGFIHAKINDISGLQNLKKLESVCVDEDQVELVNEVLKGKNVKVETEP